MSSRRAAPRAFRRARALFGAAFLGALLASAALFGGCRDVISFEEREFDPSLADGGSDGATPLTCEGYCALIDEVCTGPNAQFSSVDACLPFCSTFEVGQAGATSGNSLACRIQHLEATKAMPEGSDCAAAGPGGDGVCGSNCESYCTGMMALCPATFETVGDCTAACDPLIECGPYAVPAKTPDDPSIQCRLYHLSAAAVGFLDKEPGIDTSAQITHCPHASGLTECKEVADPVCP